MGIPSPPLFPSVNLFKIFVCSCSTWSFNCFNCFDSDDMEVVVDDKSLGDFGYLDANGLNRG